MQAIIAVMDTMSIAISRYRQLREHFSPRAFVLQHEDVPGVKIGHKTLR